MPIPRDKLLHALAGAAVAVCAMALAALAPWLGFAGVAVLAGVLVGAGYEVVQLVRREGEPDVADALATAAGAAGVAVVFAALTRFIPITS